MVRKVQDLLTAHKAEIMEHLGASAFDALPPSKVATELGIGRSRIPDLIRQGWLDFIPDGNIGNAHTYYRWRVEFVKRYRNTYKKRENKPKKISVQ